MKKIHISAFTIAEIIVTIALIWILMAWTTIYLWWMSEKAKLIEAESCAYSLNWELTSFTFDVLTSKKLKINWNLETPRAYRVSLNWWNTTETLPECYTSNTWKFCDKIKLWIFTWTISWASTEYKTLTQKEKCKTLSNGTTILFARSWDIYKVISMNKWLSEIKRIEWDLPNNKPMSVNSFNSPNLENINNVDTYWIINIYMCQNWFCENPKNFARRIIDSRSQTIELNRCRYFSWDNPLACEEREG